MTKFENWAVAYDRMLSEVKVEHPDWGAPEIYREYRLRCIGWKIDHRIKLNSGEREDYVAEYGDI